MYDVHEIYFVEYLLPNVCNIRIYANASVITENNCPSAIYFNKYPGRSRGQLFDL